MNATELTEEIDRIERVLPHLRDLGDKDIQETRLAELRKQRDALTVKAVAA